MTDLLLEMSSTGVTKNDLLCLCFPFGELSRVYQMEQNLPEWIHILKDSEHTATFAVLSAGCLSYNGFDLISNRSVTQGCRNEDTSLNGAVLETTVALAKRHKRDLVTSASLSVGARIRLESLGCLEVRHPRNPQLTVFERTSLFTRGKEAAICMRNGDWGHTYHELMHHEKDAGDSFNVCIFQEID